MSTVQGVTPGTGINQSALASLTGTTTGATGTTAQSSTADLGSEFLTLLVTQMQNQDPLNPMDTSQMTSQLAQISTVNGISQLNTTMSSLGASMNATQYLQASSLVGQNVYVSGSQLQLSQGAAQGAISLPQAAQDVTVTISDAAGNIVNTLDLGAQPAGNSTFTWNGATNLGTTAAAGTYTLSVAAGSGGTSVTATPLEYGQVSGVAMTAQGAELQVGGLGLVSLANVVQIN